LGLTLSPAGELFVVNQGPGGSSVTRFSNPTGVAAFNGNIPAGPEATFYGAFRGNELFVVKRSSGVLRVIIDPVTGAVTPNGQIPTARSCRDALGRVVRGRKSRQSANDNSSVHLRRRWQCPT